MGSSFSKPSTTGGYNNIMTHKGKPHKRASKEELDKRRARQTEVAELKKRSAAGEDVRTNKRTTEKEPIVLNAPKDKEPSFADAAKRAVLGLEHDVPKEERNIAAGVVPIGPAAGIGIFAAAVKGFKSLFGKGTSVNTASMVGRSSTLGLTKFAGKAGSLERGKFVAISSRFATNKKSIALTKTFLQKAGFTNSAALNLLGIVGSYPFAGFIKEEALQQLTFSAERALAAGDIEGAERAAEEALEQVDFQAWEKVIFAIPYANVVKEVLDFLKGSVIAIDNLLRRIAKMRGEIEFEGQSVGEEIAARDLEQEEKFAKISEEREARDIEEEEKFAGLSEEREAREKRETKKFKDIETARVQREEEETAKFAKIEEERIEREEEEKRIALVMQEVWRLRRAGQFDEADELERTVL